MKIPGYIDLQVNGLKGVDYSAEDFSLDAFVFTCEELRKEGTIGFLPTIITCAEETAKKNIKIICDALQYEIPRSLVLGFHLEGPFISPEDGARGIHQRDFIRAPDINWLNQMQEISGNMIKLITIAAEVNGAEKFIQAASKQGIIVALGHQQAKAEQIRKAVNAGAIAATHLGNGLPQHIHRFDNPIWPLLAEDKISAMIIPDGQHLNADMIKVFFRAKGVEKIIAVSDASPLALLPEGEYCAFGKKLRIKNNRIFDPQSGYLAGSHSTLRQCSEFMKTLDFLDDNAIEKMTYYNPLHLLQSGKILTTNM